MNRDLKEALRSKTVSDGDCWVWSASTNTKGYGWTGIRGLPRLAHRAAYQAFKGDIPKGMSVCHRCDRPGCINPEHLFLGTQRDNLRDASAKGRVHGQAKTHCNRGHEFTPENTYAPRPGHRECRSCKRETGRQASENYRAKRRAALSAALQAAPSTEEMVERMARRARAKAMKPRPDSDWDEPGRIHDDSKDEWRAYARDLLSAAAEGGE